MIEHLGLIQTSVLEAPAQVLELARQAVDQAPGPALALLPELPLGGFDYERKTAWAADTPGLLRELQALCQPAGLSLAGSFWTLEDGRFHNTLFLVGPELDEPLALHRKNHLFPMSREEQEFAPGGRAPLVVEHRGSRLGSAICFELRFPEIFREQNARPGGAPQLFLLPSQWPASRGEHLRALCRARAVENQAFLLSCNAVGPSMLGDLGGQSMLLSPWGQTLLLLDEVPAITFHPLDLQELERASRHFTTRQSPWYELSFRPDRNDSF